MRGRAVVLSYRRPGIEYVEQARPQPFLAWVGWVIGASIFLIAVAMAVAILFGASLILLSRFL